MRVLLFGIMKDIVAAKTLTIEAELPTVGDLKRWLKQEYPAVQNLKAVMIAVNKTYAADETILSPEDEIAIIPPLSGG
ncbi:molybdopterin converting factor subunit 1 [Chitinophaga niabensis]|uniref:Molybdopterin synthase sulfur carrier subunit n=1 Tax=Chitinophaga niabensis TaxID=536979 RepID=A0A1N6G7S0_9BACT|nr:molybdopterin converting factor subunit 1 [Chitinophaga niabensis]SIO03563.1 molybdopterin synthase sulfur carrier subunit [Chitinophaga niabensis]